MVRSPLAHKSYSETPLRGASVRRFPPLMKALAIAGYVFILWIPAQGQFVGYVPNAKSDSVTIFAAQFSGSILASPGDNVVQVLGSSVGWQSPVRVGVTPNSSTAYVTSQGDNGLWKINALLLPSSSATATNVNGSSKNPLKLAGPGGIAITNTSSPSGAPVLSAYVANQADGSVSVVNVDPTSSGQNTLILLIPTNNTASSTIPEVAATGHFVFVLENSPSASLWQIDTSNVAQGAVQISLPKGTGTAKGLSAFQLIDSSQNTHTYVVTSDATNGNAFVVDVSASSTMVQLGSGSSPVSVTSVVDPSSSSIQDIYVADATKAGNAFPIWSFAVDCSGTCTVGGATASAHAQAPPTSIAVTPDGQAIYATESSQPGIENFCATFGAGQGCPIVPEAVSVGSGPTGILLSDIALNSGPVCWFLAGPGAAPPSTAIATPACTDAISCGNIQALGACAINRFQNANAIKMTLDFGNDTQFGCVVFGSGQGTATHSPCSVTDFGIGGQTVFQVAGVYTTVLTGDNTANSSGSSMASVSTKINVLPDVQITTQPASQTINSGQTVTLKVTATSASGLPLSYQWYQGASGNTSKPIAGATSSSFTTPLLGTSNFWVQVNDGSGPVNSNTALITVNSAPTITTQPANVSIVSGQTTTLTVVASGTSPLSYQWYQGTTGSTNKLIAGATSSSFTTPALLATTDFWVRVTNALGHADSNTATVTVTLTAISPSITTQPASQTITPGQTATLTVAASGTSPFTYQWYQGNSGVITTRIAGANASSFTTPPLTSTSSYWVQVANQAGTANSNTATIIVNNGMVVIPPSSTTVAAGQSVKYTITLNSGLPTVSLSCQTPLPAGVNCLFSPLQVSAGQSFTLTLATTGHSAFLEGKTAGRMFYGLILPLPFLGLLLMSTHLKQRESRHHFLQLYTLGLLAVVMFGCGADPNTVKTSVGSVTPPGVYTVVVLGKNAQNQVVASTPVTFTVQ